MADVLISGGELIVPSDDGELAARRGDLAIRDAEIVQAGSEGELPEDWHADEVVEATGCAVMPGLVNAHCHAAMTLLRGYADDMPLMSWLEDAIWPAEAELTRDDIYWGSKLALAEMLKGGITAFADMYFAMDEVARAASELGARALLSVGLTETGDDPLGALDEAVEFVQRWQGADNDRIRAQLGPHAPYTCSGDFLSRISGAAAKNGCGIHIHLAETEDEIQTIRTEYDDTPVGVARACGLLERSPFLGAHCVHLSPGDYRHLKRRGVAVAHCPQSNQKLGSGVAPVVEMVDRGVLVSLGTDGAASTGRLDLWAEMRSASFMQKVVRNDPQAIPAELMLKMATKNGALALGYEDVGYLGPGARADVIVVDLNSPHCAPAHEVISTLAYCAGPENVRDVFVDGKRVVTGGKLESADEDEIVKMARFHSVELLKRVEDR